MRDAEHQGATPGEGGLTVTQERAVAALLTEPTLQDAAKSAGVDRSSIYRWLQQPAFRAAYRKVRQEVFAAGSRLQQAAEQAVGTLCEIMTDDSQQGAARVGAAKAVLDYAIKATEQEQIVERTRNLKGGPKVSIRDRLRRLEDRFRDRGPSLEEVEVAFQRLAESTKARLYGQSANEDQRALGTTTPCRGGSGPRAWTSR